MPHAGCVVRALADDAGVGTEQRWRKRPRNVEFSRNNTYLTAAGKFEAMWQLGKYDNTFVKEGEKWKFLEFKWYVIFRTPYHEGWVKRPIVEGLHQEGFPPVSRLHTPYEPGKNNAFLPFPPEAGER